MMWMMIMMMEKRKEKKPENRKPLVASYRHVWDTVDLFSPRVHTGNASNEYTYTAVWDG